MCRMILQQLRAEVALHLHKYIRYNRLPGDKVRAAKNKTKLTTRITRDDQKVVFRKVMCVAKDKVKQRVGGSDSDPDNKPDCSWCQSKSEKGGQQSRYIFTCENVSAHTIVQ